MDARDRETIEAWQYYETVPGRHAHDVGMRLVAEIERLQRVIDDRNKRLVSVWGECDAD